MVIMSYVNFKCAGDIGPTPDIYILKGKGMNVYRGDTSIVMTPEKAKMFYNYQEAKEFAQKYPGVSGWDVISSKGV